MTMLKLKASDHSTRPGTTMFELLDGDNLIAGIYPTDRGLKIVSKYITGQTDLVSVEDFHHPPAIAINLIRES